MKRKPTKRAKDKPGKVMRAKTSPAGPKPAASKVEVGKAKGRPMLVWVGKHPQDRVASFPAQLTEIYDPTGRRDDWKNLLFHGDNKEVLGWLLANGFRGKVNLVYIDPPFDSGADYVRRVQLRGPAGAVRFDGESYSLGEQIQYTDIWANDNYLQFMYERLLLLRELMAEHGFIFLHTDWHKTHLLRCLLEEVFGPENFRNEIVVRRGRKKNLQKQFEGIESLGVETDTVLLFSKSTETRLHILTVEERAAPEQWQSFWRGNVERPSMQYEILGFKPTHGQLLWKKERGLRAAENYKAFLSWRGEDESKTLLDYWKETGEELEFVRLEPGARCPEYWIPPKEEGILGNDWLDIQAYAYSHDFKTEKHEELLRRTLELASEEGDLVLDCFIGSGTTAASAQKLGRRWVGCDINKGAIQITTKRLRQVIEEQTQTAAKAKSGRQQTLDGLAETPYPPEPASLAFAVFRVNDYDLQIQHNEAVNLACEQIGIERTKTDPYFDGKLGKRLAKVTPFNHPLSPLDLEELKNELKSRPEEDRDITVVCLGKEAACDAWLEDWNRLRRQGTVPNQIDVIELRTDPKYGKLFVHKPAGAKVKIARHKDKVTVEVTDFLSPSIIERLTAQEGVLKPKITDWRSMVDTVMIDTAYNGEVFNIALADVPEKKTDLVNGRYELPAPKNKTTVAVKITDMLGEEVLITREI